MNTKKLIKYILMAAIMVLMIDSLPPKGVGDDTSLFLNPVVNAPPPSVMILMDESGSMYDLPCAVPDCQEDCGLGELSQPNNQPFFINMGYNPLNQYPVFDTNISTSYNGQPGAFYPTHVYYESGCQAWSDLGSISSACNNYTYNPTNCINGLNNYGYYYSEYNQVAFYSGNLLNFYPPKYVVLRKSIADIITYNQQVLLPKGEEVRIGLSDFNSGTGGNILKSLQPPCSQLGNATPQDYDFKGKFYNSLYGSSSSYSSDIPTSTPLADALLDIGSYFANNNTYFCQLINGCFTKTPNACCPGSCTCNMGFLNPSGTQRSGSDSWCGSYNPNWQCEKMFTIVVTDGLANYDRYIEKGPSSLANFPPSNNNCSLPGNDCECTSYANETSWNGPHYTDPCFTDEIASFLHNNSIRSDATCPYTEGGPSLDTYTIGFYGSSVSGSGANCSGTPIYQASTNNCQLPFDVLQNAARLGNGLFTPASNYGEIKDALVKAIMNIIQKNHTYGTPSLPQIVTEGLNGTSTTNVFKAFIASFIPKNQDFWVGHLREYTGAASTTGTISLYDKNGAPFTGNTSTNGQCSFSEYVPPPIWDAGADLSDTTLLPCTSNVDDLGLNNAGCYLAPNLRNVYTIAPDLTSAFISTTTGNGEWTWSAGGEVKLSPASSSSTSAYAFTTSNANLHPSDFGITDTSTAGITEMDNIIDYVLGPKQDGIHVLGDIFHSDPTLINRDALAGDWVQLSDPQITSLDYQQYLNKVYNMPQIVIAGADDGMIHAFYAGGYEGGATINAAGNYVPDGNAQFSDGTGQEVWAFIPYDLLPKLQYMYDPALVPTTTTGQYWTTEGIYTTTSTTHVYYVDASPFVRDVYLPGVPNGLSGVSGNAQYWHTIMIIGERLGGTYYICLDITDTLHPKFMWEFTTNDMGFTFGEVAPNPPPIGPVWLGYDPATDATFSSPQLRWVALLNGGWDPGILTPVRGNGFYMVDIATGKLVWKYDSQDNANMSAPIAATPIGITQGMLGTIHPWWMESFVPDLGGQLWQFSFLHLGDNPPGVWAGNLGSNGIVATCINATDTNCFSGQRVFAAQNPPPTPRNQGQEFYYQPSAIGDPCGDLWIGIAAGSRNNPLSCTPINNLYEINTPMPYVIQTPLLTGSNLTQLTSLSGLNSGLCGAGAGWWVTLSSFTNTAMGTKSLSIPYATGGVEYFSVFTPDQNACVAQTTTQFSCNTLGGTGTMLGMAIYQIPGTGYKTGQLVFAKSTQQGIPSPPIPVTSIVGGGSSSGGSTSTPTPFSIPACGSGAGSMALSTQIYGSTSEGSIFNVGSIAGSNMLMYPILQLCIPKSTESTYMNLQNTWSTHGGR